MRDVIAESLSSRYVVRDADGTVTNQTGAYVVQAGNDILRPPGSEVLSPAS